VIEDDSFILSIDQGTSGTSASLYNHDGKMVASVDIHVKSIFPRPGWVEQDPYELLESIKVAFHTLVEKENIRPGQIKCMGVANQGETLLIWNTETGEPLYNVIGWQCVRSADLCKQMIDSGLESEFRMKTGLPIHPEWPATKVPWFLENIEISPYARKNDRLALSSLDTWFIYHLTKEKMFVTDHSTVSRSGMYNISDRKWDHDLVKLFHAEDFTFPEIKDSSTYFGMVDFGNGYEIPWTGNALDQSAALFGQSCTKAGDVKITYGTCVGFWYNLGNTIKRNKKMEVSIAWTIDGQPTYAAVGETTTAGNIMIWLKDKLNIKWNNSELSDIAFSARGQDDFIFVAALSGLGAPYWIPEARGAIYGITEGVGLEHFVRAGLESVGYSVCDLSNAFAQIEDLHLPSEIKVDGGMTTNNFLMQFQADILGKKILVPENPEGTSTGVAYLAGLATDYYSDLGSIRDSWKSRKVYEPKMSTKERKKLYERWQKAVIHTIDRYS